MPRRGSSRQYRKKYRTRRQRKTCRKNIVGGVNTPRADDRRFVFILPRGKGFAVPIVKEQHKSLPTRKRKVYQTAEQKERKALQRQRRRWHERARTLKEKKTQAWRVSEGLAPDSAVAPYNTAKAPWSEDDEGSMAVALAETLSQKQRDMGETY